MSLVIWLPMTNGNATNQGLGNPSITSTDIVSNNLGKLDKCCEFNTTTSRILMENYDYTSVFTGDWSVAFWVYDNRNGSRTCYVTQFGMDTGNNGIAVEKTAGQKFRIRWKYGNTTDDQTAITDVEDQTWIHFCIVKNGTTITVYKNGVSVFTNTVSVYGSYPESKTVLALGNDTRGATNGFIGYMNDFRLYDHALSLREIKLISRGLAYHYPLSVPGNENLAVGTNQVYTSPASTGGTSGSAYINNVYLTLNEGEIAENDEFTISYNYEVTGNSSTSAYIYDQFNGSQSVPVNYCYMSGQAIETGRHVHTFRANATQAAVTGNQRTRLRLRLATDGAVLKVWNLKLERGNKATPWIPSVDDDEYVDMGLNDNIEYDVSGYGHNLTKTDITYESGSPRYSSDAVFNGTTSTARLVTSLTTDRIIINEATFAFWIKKGEYDSTNRYIYFGITSIYFNASTDTIYFQWQHGTDASNYSSNTWNTNLQPAVGEWHHVAITFNNGVVYRYLDGQNTGLSDRTGTGNAIVGVRSVRGALANTSLNGSLSDFRIYATALSDDDILELYNTSASIASNGTLLASQIIE